MAWLAFMPYAHGQPPRSLNFADWTPRSRIDFLHFDGSGGKKYLVEVIASGMATFDYDLDGDIDAYFLNGAELPGTHYDPPPENKLFRNQGGLTFVEATTSSRLGDKGFGLGIAVGDFDNDGFPDLYLSNLGPNVLYRNLGDGTFAAVMDQPSLGRGNKVGGGVSMLDIDRDGNLDIYAANYVQFDPRAHEVLVFRGKNVYGGPLLNQPESDDLLKNLGDGRFENISQTAGILADIQYGMGTIALDFDQDGDTDIFVANDSTKNTLWKNDGLGSFTDVATEVGVAFDHRGNPQGSMGVDAADYNGDLLLDLYQTAFTKQFATLYQNSPGGFFIDGTSRTGAGLNTFYAVNWGAAFADLDNDGDKDLFVANGHIQDNMDEFDDTVQYKLRNQILENRGRKFVDVTPTAGDGLQIVESSRGAAVDDLDGDGRLDILVLNSRAHANVLRNQSASTGNWVYFDLVGTQANRSAVGSRVVVVAGSRSQVLEVHSGRGYQSHFGSRLHFGLGGAKKIDRVDVYWLGGERESYFDLDINAHYLLRQGQPAWRQGFANDP
jgi:hypothetical protein